MNTQRRVFGLALLLLPLLLIFFIFALDALQQKDNKPTVEILTPSNPHFVMLGEHLLVESQSRDDEGISRVEMLTNGALAHTATASEGEKLFRVTQSWLAPSVGPYRVTVIAYDNAGQASAAAVLSVTVEPAPGPTPIPSPSPSPTVTTTASPTPGTEPQGPDGCTLDAAFVADVTIPDNTELAPGTEFVKTWRLLNNGTCDWDEGFQFVFVGGEQMGGPASVNAPPTLAGATADVSVLLRAPQEPGAHQANWRMRAPNGQDFGSRPFVKIVVPPPDTPTPLVAPTATPGPKPDLDITLVAGNLELDVGEMLELRVTVRNNGPGAAAGTALVRAVLRPDLVLEARAPALPAGGQEVVLLIHTFNAPAELDVFISVDPQDEISEADESNNVEQVRVVASPPLHASGAITTTAGLSFDLDDALAETGRLDVEWRVIEGQVYLGLLNGAGAALLSGEAESVSYALVAGLVWKTEQLLLADLAPGALFGFRTSAGRVGYARVVEVLDPAYTSVRLEYWVWASP